MDFIFNSAQKHVKLAFEAQLIDLDNNFFPSTGWLVTCAADRL